MELGVLFGLRLRARRSALAGSLALWLLLAAIGVWWAGRPPGAAALEALAALALHWLSTLFHQLGHAAAARQAGYPMRGLTLWWALVASHYPRDEPPLPARIHIRRALGGPIASLALSAVGGLALLALPADMAARWVATFFFLENLLVFTLQALVPLGFNDGATLYRYLRAREPEQA